MYAFEQTQGQPWLVNALAYQAGFRDVTDRTQPISLEVMQRAKETLVKSSILDDAPDTSINK